MTEAKTILVVEDEGVVARQIQLSLMDLGYRVPATADSAEEALRLAAESRPDLVLMDVHLAGALDGIETAAQLRERFDVPIIYLTAYADPATVERAKVTEPYAYLIKPFDASRLAAAVEVALYKHELDQQLRLSEAKYAGIVCISADGIVSVDEEQKIVLFNHGAEKIFGYSSSEVLGQSLDVLIPERFRAPHRQHVQRFSAGPLAARGMERELSIVGQRKNGEEFPAACSISKLTVAGRTLLTVALRDHSELQRIEHEQRFLSELGAVLSSTLDYRDTLASIVRLMVPDTTDWCLLDLVEEDGEVRRMKVACGDPDKGEIAETLERIGIDRSRPHLVWQVLRTREPVLKEMTEERIQSLSRSEEHGAALRAADIKSMLAVPLLIRGQLLGALVLGSSSPSRRYGPNDLRLAEEVAYRAALAIENARHYRTAQRAIEARDSVLGIVAHDLRNPLGTILMQLALLQRRAPDLESAASKPVKVIERSVARMKRLLQDLLDVTRIEAGRLSLMCDPASAERLVLDAVETQHVLASSSSLELRLELAAELPQVWADRDRILQVFENLIGNAMKFTGAGGRITVGAAPLGGEVIFWVSDTGDGISAEDLPHLFERFWQARSKRNGAGLGLPIVKGIIDAHGGRVWVESTPGLGSTFFFAIPTAVSAHHRPALGAELVPPSSSHPNF